MKKVEPGRQFAFPPFRLDTANEILWRDDEAIRLQPKVFAVLEYLVERPGRLVTKTELLAALWPETAVTEGVLKACIKAVRDALGDDADHPRFIETAHRRGYRFIARRNDVSPARVPPGGRAESAALLVGREEEMATLRQRLEAALRGERQLVFVTGEPGIGKTTLVEAFLQHAADAGATVARGACLEQYGGSAGHLPWLDAISALCRHAATASTLARHAPTWLAQLPALAAAVPTGPVRGAPGPSRESLLREMAAALEALAAERPLAILLEDLHWSDYSSLDLLSYLARRRERARLLLIGTYRPVDVILGDHPLKAVKAELAAHRLCAEMPLDFLTERAVAEYLAERFPGHPLPADMTRFVHERSEGNPLFMVNVADDLVARGVIVQRGSEWVLREAPISTAAPVPEGILQLIERMVDRLRPEERRLLEAASVAGVEFTVAAVAAGLETDLMEVEEACEALARRRQLLTPAAPAELPDRTITASYRFIHALYRSALYGPLPAGRRAQLHHRIGEQREAAYGRRAAEIAVELALHFEEGRDTARALSYLQQAAESARGRFANQEAVALARRGLALLAGLPEGEGRDQHELRLQLTLGLSFVHTVAISAPETESSMARARELCQRLGEPPELSVAIFGLFTHHLVAGRLSAARELADQLLRMASQKLEDSLLLGAHTARGYTAMFMGDLRDAEDHTERALALSQAERRRAFFSRFAFDPLVYLLSLSARTLWLRGYPARARQRMQEALAAAEEAGDPRSRIYASISAAGVHRHLGEPQEALELAERCFVLCQEHGVLQERAWAGIFRSVALVGTGRVEEGIAGLREAVAVARGLRQDSPGLRMMLADGLRRAGRREEALAAVGEALVAIESTGERFWEAETYRVKGELLLAGGDPSAVEEADLCFRHALEIARRQDARSLELRAAMSLSRLWLRQGRREEARQTLEERYRWFTEGFDTRDLRAAQALLAELE